MGSKKLVFLTILIVASGCSHYFYIPNSHNIPMLKKKGDGHIALGLGGQPSLFGSIGGVEMQTSYAVSKGLGLMANSAWGNNQESNPEKESGSGNGGEIGFGHHKIFGGIGSFETYSGLGWGMAKNKYTDSGMYSEIETKFRRQFIQTSLGLSTKTIEIAGSLRISNLKYHKLNFSGDIIQNAYSDFTYITNNRRSFLLEPAIMIRVGTESLKLQFQTSFSRNLSHPEFPQLNRTFSLSLFGSIN